MDNMEIGGYRELDLRCGCEYYTGPNVARLNMGRAGIYHALRRLGCSKLYLPYYECGTVRGFLAEQGMETAYYHIDRTLRPLPPEGVEDCAAVLLVNYLGLLPAEEIRAFTRRFPRVIVDNTQAFFAPPEDGAYSVYSPRKFFGVADGCYVIGKGAAQGLEAYQEDFSAGSSSFLLRRIESGGNENYPYYLESERRLEESGARRMSRLTHALLDNVDYGACLEKRRRNFKTARALFDGLNRLPPTVLDRMDKDAAPMAYPLVIEDAGLRQRLKERRIFVGQWWKYLLDELPEDAVETWLSRYLLPIQIDHRYGEAELRYTLDVVTAYLAEKGRK